MFCRCFDTTNIKRVKRSYLRNMTEPKTSFYPELNMEYYKILTQGTINDFTTVHDFGQL